MLCCAWLGEKVTRMKMRWKIEGEVKENGDKNLCLEKREGREKFENWRRCIYLGREKS